MITLEDRWVLDGAVAKAEGDAVEIDRLLREELRLVAHSWDGWRTLLRRQSDGSLWELDYPQSELHGGGPRRLQQLEINDPATWE